MPPTARARRCSAVATRDPDPKIEAPFHKAVKLHCLAGLCVCAVPAIAADHFVPLSNHLVNGDVQVGHQQVHLPHHGLIPLHIGRLAPWSIMVIEVRRHVMAHDFGFFVVDEILKVLAHKRLHFICRECGCHVASFYGNYVGEQQIVHLSELVWHVGAKVLE